MNGAPNPCFFVFLQTRFGTVRAGARKTGLCEVAFVAPHEIPVEGFWEPSPPTPAPDDAVSILQAFGLWMRDYEARHFRTADFLLEPEPLSDFARRILAACCAIPAGQTRTYAQLAADAGFSPSHARAAARVMARNRLPLVIPCHRVTASRGLGGYGPGLSIKAALLSHESPRAANPEDMP